MRVVQNVTGRLHIVAHNPQTGEIVEDRWINNLVTAGGRTLLADLLTGAIRSVSPIKLAVGGHTTAPTDPPAVFPPPASADTVLHSHQLIVNAQAGTPRVLASEADGPTRIVTPITAVLEANPETTEVLYMREAGLVVTKFVESSVGEAGDEGEPADVVEPGTQVLYNRVTFDTISKEPQLQMTLTWEVIF